MKYAGHSYQIYKNIENVACPFMRLITSQFVLTFKSVVSIHKRDK